MCRNAALDRLRRQKGRREEPLPEDLTTGKGPEDLLLEQERAEALQKALLALSPRERQLFYRKYYYLQPTAQLAAELGLTERAVEGKLYRIRKKLQKQLGGERP